MHAVQQNEYKQNSSAKNNAPDVKQLQQGQDLQFENTDSIQLEKIQDLANNSNAVKQLMSIQSYSDKSSKVLKATSLGELHQLKSKGENSELSPTKGSEVAQEYGTVLSENLKTRTEKPLQLLKNNTVVQRAKSEGDKWVTEPDDGKKYPDEISATRAEQENKTKSDRKEKLSAHVSKLSGERKALEKWNTDGAGRNQGLRHIIDYAYAPPPKAASDNKMNEYGALSNQVFGPKKLAENKIDVTAGIKGGYLENVGVTEEGAQTKAELKELQSRKSKMMEEGKDSAAKKAIGLSDEYKSISDQIKMLETKLVTQSKYTLAQDTSKKGRLTEVERMNKLGAGGIKGKEIETVTNTLDQVGSKEKVTMKRPEKDAMRTINKGELVREGKGKWGQQPSDVQAPNTAVSAEFEGEGLSVKKWGPTEDSIRYSTMMGATKKKKGN